MTERTEVRFHKAGLPVMFVDGDQFGINGLTKAALLRLVSPNAVLPGDWTEDDETPGPEDGERNSFVNATNY